MKTLPLFLICGAAFLSLATPACKPKTDDTTDPNNTPKSWVVKTYQYTSTKSGTLFSSPTYTFNHYTNGKPQQGSTGSPTAISVLYDALDVKVLFRNSVGSVSGIRYIPIDSYGRILGDTITAAPENVLTRYAYDSTSSNAKGIRIRMANRYDSLIYVYQNGEIAYANAYRDQTDPYTYQYTYTALPVKLDLFTFGGLPPRPWEKHHPAKITVTKNGATQPDRTETYTYETDTNGNITKRTTVVTDASAAGYTLIEIFTYEYL